MKRFASPGLLMVAIAIVVVTNLALLAAAGWNRRGEPTAGLSLSERELAIPADRHDEDTGLALSLVLAHEPPGVLRRVARWKGYQLASVEYDWLDKAKLLELGFRLDLDPAQPDAAEYYSHAMPRRACFVIEYEGEAWNRWISGRGEQVVDLRREVENGTAKQGALADAEAVLAVDRTMRSRLFLVDVGLDADALQSRYGDRHRYAVVAGLLRPKIVQRDDGVAVLSGEVIDLAVDRVHVSRQHRRQLEPFLSDETWNEIEEREREEAEIGWPSVTPPRYRATVSVGRRYEPWLISVATLETMEVPE
jgi:hypothetical protein